MRFIIPIIALSFLAGPAFADDFWLNPRESTSVVHNVPSPRPGKNVSEYTPTTTTAILARLRWNSANVSRS